MRARRGVVWLAAGAVLIVLAPRVAAQVGEPACIATPRSDPSNPALILEREVFGFHDEELLLCSPGHERPTHIAARLWVPRECPGVGGCPGVLIAHGFAFTKETTVADMQNAASRGMYVLSYDVRGHGGSGDQVGLMGREEIADQAAMLAWFHEHVKPTKIGVYGISQGGAHAVMAAVFNCGRDRAASFDSTIPCDQGGRWVDAIAPVQAPTSLQGDGTCTTFAMTAIPESRFNLALTREVLRCSAAGTALEEPVGEATAPLPEFAFSIRDTLSRADRIDVPAYLVTSFYDRLVLPQNVTRLYERLRERANDGLYEEDLRLIISNDGHGAVGGNFAVLNDVFRWLELELKDGAGASLRTAPAAIAEEWADDAFRLEAQWPIPGTTEAAYYLSRGGSDPEANGHLTAGAPGEAEPADEMKNVPVVSSPPDVPFADFLGQITASTGTRGVPGARLVYASGPAGETMEITGLPEVSLWVSSSNTGGNGKAQLHVALAELDADGSVTEFARNRRGVRDLGPEPVLVELPLTVSAHRIDPGSRLLLTITPTDPGEAQPFLTTDTTFVHHEPGAESRLSLPLAPVNRTPPPGEPPSGPAFPDNAIGAICAAFGLPCGS